MSARMQNDPKTNRDLRPADRIRAVAFDLDGTLVDTAPDLAAAVNAALAMLGCRPLGETRIADFIGAGLDALVAAALRESLGRAPPAGALDTARKLVRRRYAERVFHLSRVYPDVAETLQSLRAQGLALCCVTNKDAAFTLPLLRAAGLEPLFAFTLCADRTLRLKPHPDLLLAACARLAVTPPELLYVGDAPTDVSAARAPGCPVAVVGYGYRRGVPLHGHGADWIVQRFAEIVALVTPAPSLRQAEGGLHGR